MNENNCKWCGADCPSDKQFCSEKCRKAHLKYERETCKCEEGCRCNCIYCRCIERRKGEIGITINLRKCCNEKKIIKERKVVAMMQ